MTISVDNMNPVKEESMNMINFDATPEDQELIRKIAERAVLTSAEFGVIRDALDVRMDITACHLNGNPLRLADLLIADDFNFGHDVCGIERHLDRTTGQLMNCFSPRFSE